MKVMTILGTRPEIIRLSRVIPALDEACEHVLVHTGQSHDRELSGVFFEELGALLDAAGVDAAWFGLDERAGDGTAGLSMM